MSSLRIKVQFGEETTNNNRQKADPVLKFIHVIDSPSNKTIDELIRTLQKYINEQFSTNNTKISQLVTNDGFVLSKSDICSAVLKDNDHIICIDIKQFVRDNYSTIDFAKLWLDMKQHDASDNQQKYIQIGLNSFSRLFIRFCGAPNNYGIYIFNIYELISIASEKRRDNLIFRIDNSDEYNETSSVEWFIECKWEYDTVSNQDLFIICNLKIGSSDNVFSDKLGIILDHSRMRIQKGEITHLSTDTNDGSTLTDQQRQYLKQLAAKLPPPKRTGPQIDTITLQNLKLTKHECEGESCILMAGGNTNTVYAYQDIRSKNEGSFHQYFDITHIIFSKKPTILPEILNQKRVQPVDKSVSVASLTVVYQAHDGSWRECQDVAIAPIPVRNEEPKWLTDSVINIQPDKLISFTIKGWISVKGETGVNNQARSHKSLPQPLKLKIIITDNVGKQCSLVVEQLNKPLDLFTRESYLKMHQSSIKELLAFVYADDVETEERVYTVVYIDKESTLIIRTPNAYSGSLDRREIRAKEFNAKQSKTTEINFDDIQYKYYDNVVKAIALFDPETYIMYAIRLEVSTKTSKSEETICIPLEKIK